MNIYQEKFDVVVVGGGPAGILAAGRAAELGANVVLLEKNQGLGRKLLLTGKGRCNITQAGHDNREFIKKLGNNGKFLFSALSAFGPQQVIDFFETRKLSTKIERGGRIFPVTDRATDVLKVLIQYLKSNKVRVLFGAEVKGFKISDQKIEYVKLKNPPSYKVLNGQVTKIYGRHYIICSGGKSYPETGSIGEGYCWAKKMGHKIIEPKPSLVPVKIKEPWVKYLQGLSLKNAEVEIIQNNKKQDSRFGEMLFTHFGLSGPIILDVSKKIGELFKQGKVFIEIDLKPALDFSQLDKRLQRNFAENPNKDFKNYLPEIEPKKMTKTIIYLSGIGADRKLNSIKREERKKLVNLLKGIRLTVDGLMNFKEAIVTSGGVDLKEVDSKTMKSKIIDNLFFAGEILNLDGPSGGYNLQICWSTGYAAGTYAAIGK